MWICSALTHALLHQVASAICSTCACIFICNCTGTRCEATAWRVFRSVYRKAWSAANQPCLVPMLQPSLNAFLAPVTSVTPTQTHIQGMMCVGNVIISRSNMRPFAALHCGCSVSRSLLEWAVKTALSVPKIAAIPHLSALTIPHHLLRLRAPTDVLLRRGVIRKALTSIIWKVTRCLMRTAISMQSLQTTAIFKLRRWQSLTARIAQSKCLSNYGKDGVINAMCDTF